MNWAFGHTISQKRVGVARGLCCSGEGKLLIFLMLHLHRLFLCYCILEQISSNIELITQAHIHKILGSLLLPYATKHQYSIIGTFCLVVFSQLLWDEIGLGIN